MGIPYQSVLDEEERSLSGAFFRVLPIDRESVKAYPKSPDVLTQIPHPWA